VSPQTFQTAFVYSFSQTACRTKRMKWQINMNLGLRKWSHNYETDANDCSYMLVSIQVSSKSEEWFADEKRENNRVYRSGRRQWFLNCGPQRCLPWITLRVKGKVVPVL
jgi:hypothetical protein